MRYLNGICVAAVSLMLIATGTAFADDLRGQLEGIFTEALQISLTGSDTLHGKHFRPDNVATSGRIISALSSFIGANASSFPLSSTSTGLTFDFSSGVPVPITTSAGPIFAERGQTIGAKHLNVGANVSVLNLNRIRGTRTGDMVFNFTHQNVGRDTTLMGDSENEYDYLTLSPNLDLSATVLAIHATYGLLDRLDVGVAIPIVSVAVKAEPEAHISSFTYARDSSANHFFAGEGSSPGSPKLTLDGKPLDERRTGIGDIALRGKVNLVRESPLDLAALVEVRLPTGNEDNFLGSGNASYKMMLIASHAFGNFSPHANLGYDKRTSNLDRDQIDLTLGYDQKIGDRLTVAAEWMGEFEIGDAIEALRFPAPTAIGPKDAEGNQVATLQLPSTNIRRSDQDNIMNTSLGLKYTPKPNLVVVANVIFPANTAGLRSDFVPTLGVQFSL